MAMVSITVNGKKFQVPAGMTILQACRMKDIYIPTLCYHPELKPAGACRLCVVEVNMAKTLVAACVYPVADGMEVKTNSERVRKARRTIVELLLTNHPKDCLTCLKSSKCELQKIAQELGVRKLRFEGGERRQHIKDESTPSLVRDPEKCILCGRCVRMCHDIQGMDVYGFQKRGFNTLVAPAFDCGLGDVACSLCGQCATVCPTGAIMERDDTDKVWAAVNDPDKIVLVQMAPSVRVALGEEFGMAPGSIVTGKMVSALRKMGFDYVFDINFAADLTIMEEGYEFIDRIKNKGVLPMITSCSPGWVNTLELKYPGLIPHLSTAKSPQGMFGAVAKTYFAERKKIDPSKIVTVSVMPCTAKKYEAARPELSDSGFTDIDIVITTRELGRMMRSLNIDFANLPDGEFDSPLGTGTGAAVIFGTTGGVMEAALRTVAEVVTGESFDKVEYKEVRGIAETREAIIPVGDLQVKVAVVNTLKAAQEMCKRVAAGTADYHFIEIMACPGGCIGGGGQPIPVDFMKRMQRQKALFSIDEASVIRKSHENPEIKTLYKEFLGQPLSEKAHKLLHTSYKNRKK